MADIKQYKLYIEVLLPLALPKLYTYAVPDELVPFISIGKRVEVQFGKYKIYSAIIYTVSSIAPIIYKPKEIIAILDETPIVTEKQLAFWTWIASYYLCTLGEVMQAALPSYLKLDSESVYCRNLNQSYQELTLSDDAYLLIEAFEFQTQLTAKTIRQILQKKSIYNPIKELLQNQLIYIEEVIKEKYQTKTEVYVRWHSNYNNTTQKQIAFSSVKRAPKQENILLIMASQSLSDIGVKRTELIQKAKTNYATLQSLVDKGIVEIYETKVDRIATNRMAQQQEFILNEQQKLAFVAILNSFKEHKPVLLHGVTSSGKTLIYTKLIQQLKDKQQQILYLLPEIALTTQLIQRLKQWLGNITVYHSKLSNAERVEVWNKVVQQDIQIIVGARSALLLPFSNLGLIIIDEEHDGSYKQQEPNPRYHARDAALSLAKLHQANCILGSATPSIESYFNTQIKKYDLVTIANRYYNTPLPVIEFVDLRQAKKQKQLVSGISFYLRDAITLALEKKEQVILFQNRRGYAPYLECETCGWIPMCKNCDVTLTYHKYTNDLRCHYCGYAETNYIKCKACNDNNLQQKGIGTERIEDDLKLLFPTATIGRMDYDTVRNKHGHERIIQQFEQQEIDILVGTQMVTKGLDFTNLSLVGVLNADNLLYFPDFRAQEKAYQLLIQVSGRAGRRATTGKVIIQLGDLNHPIVQKIKEHNYLEFYKDELYERKAFNYPPFSRLLVVKLKHKEYAVVADAAQYLAQQLQPQFPDWVKGPVKPLLQKINNLYIQEVVLKIPKDTRQLAIVKQQLLITIDQLSQFQKFKHLIVIKDVDVM